MKVRLTVKIFSLAAMLMLFVKVYAQTDANWTAQQLMQPAALANIIKTQPDSITIISVGPFSTIPNALNVGMVSKAENMEKLKTKFASLDKRKKIVVYCGCCPFEHCPNVRPAIQLLKDEGFTNYYLLNLPHNIKINWIDEGFPVTKQ